MGLSLTHDGFLFVADAGSHRIVRIGADETKKWYAGQFTGEINSQFLNSPAGIAVDRQGNLFVADPQNYLVKKITPVVPRQTGGVVDDPPAFAPFVQPPDAPVQTEASGILPKLDASALHVTQPFPWPVAPQNQWHEVAGVVGEARGNFNGTALDHLHAGLLVRGVMG
jgi:DNA-binding beta-propeller fold protein YncE